MQDMAVDGFVAHSRGFPGFGSHFWQYMERVYWFFTPGMFRDNRPPARICTPPLTRPIYSGSRKANSLFVLI